MSTSRVLPLLKTIALVQPGAELAGHRNRKVNTKSSTTKPALFIRPNYDISTTMSTLAEFYSGYILDILGILKNFRFKKHDENVLVFCRATIHSIW